MKLTSDQIKQVEKIIRRAGESLRNNFKKVKIGKVKMNKGDIVTKADFAAEKIIIEGLKKYFPEHDIMTEENEKAKIDGKDFLWVIDPLDGTRSFMRSIPLFATSMALTYKGAVIFGMVYLPLQDELFWAQKGEGAYLNGKKIKVNLEKDLEHMMISLSFVKDRSDYNQNHNIYKMTSKYTTWFPLLGSWVLAMCYLACGRIDAIISKGAWPWDCAASGLMLQEAGGKITDMKGDIWDWRKPIQDVVASNPNLHREVMDKIMNKL